MAKDRPTHRTPRSTAAARKMLERFAEISDQISGIEARRNAAIADANAAADTAGAELLAERDDITAKLEPWWAASKAQLTQGKRKSAELGGCVVGTVAGRESLEITGDEAKVVAALIKKDWAKPLLRVKTTLDRAAILKSLGGVYRKQLATLGLQRKEGAEAFFIKRTEQGGTQVEIKG